MAFVTVQDIQATLGKEIVSERQEELERCCNAACDWVSRTSGRIIEQTEATVILDGCDAVGPGHDTLYLPHAWRPVKHLTPDFVVVTENGVSLTAAIGYSTSAGFNVVGANSDDQRVRIIRIGCGWYADVQNISVTAKVGWAGSAIPASVKQFGIEAAVRFLRAPTWLGKSSVSRPGGTIAFEKELSAESQQTLAWLRGI